MSEQDKILRVRIYTIIIYIIVSCKNKNIENKKCVNLSISI